MIYPLSLVAFSPVLPISAADLWKRAFEIPQDLYYLAEHPSGADFCNKRLGRKQAMRFDQRYGKRFNKLIEVVRLKGPSRWPEGDVQLASCIRVSPRTADKMLESFDRDLASFEKRYDFVVNGS